MRTRGQDFLVFHNLCFFLQKVVFHDISLHGCRNSKYTFYSQPQALSYTAIFSNMTSRNEGVIALPGKFQNILMRSDNGKPQNVVLSWLEIPMLAYPRISNKYPKCPGYNKQELSAYVRNTGFFYFLKYVDSTHNHLFYIEEEHLGIFPPCMANLSHNPKLFSQKQVQQLCKNKGMSLPEFISKHQQDNFLSHLKRSKNMFVVEAFFIGLQHSSTNQVSSQQFPQSTFVS